MISYVCGSSLTVNSWKSRISLFSKVSYIESNRMPHRLEFSSYKSLLGSLLMRRNFLVDGIDVIDHLMTAGMFADRLSAIHSLFRHNQREIEEAFPAGCTFALLDAVFNPVRYSEEHGYIIDEAFKALAGVVMLYAEHINLPGWRCLPSPRKFEIIEKVDFMKISRPSQAIHESNRVIAEITSQFEFDIGGGSDEVLWFRLRTAHQQRVYLDMRVLGLFNLKAFVSYDPLTPPPRMKRFFSAFDFSSGFESTAILPRSRILASCSAETITILGLAKTSDAFVIDFPSNHGNPCAIRFVESNQPNKAFLLAENVERATGYVIEDGSLVLDHTGKPLEFPLSKRWNPYADDFHGDLSHSPYNCLHDSLIYKKAFLEVESGQQVIAPLPESEDDCSKFEDVMLVRLPHHDFGPFKYLLVDSADTELIKRFSTACNDRDASVPVMTRENFSPVCLALSAGDNYAALQAIDSFLGGITYCNDRMQSVEQALSSSLDAIPSKKGHRFNSPK